ncbi:MAG: tRNA (N6-isopentenyl adenosine(37)-C2)-methylthiotransferase MiaB [Myxococcota bacterium]|jgi:tRNA-2-methylthio-N6-dimethylallyladenosine synthase
MFEANLDTAIDDVSFPTKRVHIITYGCQMNAFDSRRILQVLQKQGYAEAADPAMADLVLVNTCSVRDRPEKKVFGTLSRLLPLKRNNPEVLFGVCGCAAQQYGGELLKKMSYLDLVFGPDNIANLPEILQQAQAGHRVVNTQFMPKTDYEFLEVDSSVEPGPTAFLTIMKGCDRFCSYCIVPTVRGREVSKPVQLVLDEAKALIDGGVREITLLGQNVNSYGKGLADAIPFVTLLEKIAALPALYRLRFVTSHPADADERLLDAIGSIPNLAHALHLPLQSGSNQILEAMRRGYTFESYLNKVERVKAACPDVALSTDMIVGFPGETDADFQKSLDALAAVQYEGMFSFKYSPRPGTRAAQMPDDVPEAVKVERLAQLQALGDEIAAQRMARYHGRVEEVLVEGISRNQASLDRVDSIPEGMIEYYGRLSTGVVVNFTMPNDAPDPIGTLTMVRIDEVLVHSLRGTGTGTGTGTGMGRPI